MPKRVTVGVREQQDGIQDSQPPNNSGIIPTNTSRRVMGGLELVSAKRLPVKNAGNSRQRDHAARALRSDGLRRSAPETSRIARLQSRQEPDQLTTPPFAFFC